MLYSNYIALLLEKDIRNNNKSYFKICQFQRSYVTPITRQFETKYYKNDNCFTIKRALLSTIDHPLVNIGKIKGPACSISSLVLSILWIKAILFSHTRGIVLTISWPHLHFFPALSWGRGRLDESFWFWCTWSLSLRFRSAQVCILGTEALIFFIWW